MTKTDYILIGIFFSLGLLLPFLLKYLPVYSVSQANEKVIHLNLACIKSKNKNKYKDDFRLETNNGVSYSCKVGTEYEEKLLVE